MTKDLPDLGLHYGQTIGTGAFAIIKEARKPHRSTVVAVKFIDKQAAAHKGIEAKDVLKEITLHKHSSPHRNVIKFLDSGESAHYYWIGMELASGGDLFDKIEPDEGVGEDVAHFYFTQLMNGIGFIHSKGVAHRDIKPENIFLDENGNLKIGDFGLAALFRNPANGKSRLCTTSCGSPPYIAPEVLEGHYEGDKADIWSCGIVLFALFCGATPWMEPLMDDPDFYAYASNSNNNNVGGITREYPWNKVPLGAISLIRAMLRLDKQKRYSLEEIRLHPWVNRRNILVGANGECNDPIALATMLLGNLRVTEKPLGGFEGGGDYMGGSQPVMRTYSQYDTPSNNYGINNFGVNDNVMMFSQQMDDPTDDEVYNLISQDPVQVQFASGMIPDTMSQRAQKFKDLIPMVRFTRFYTKLSFEVLTPRIIAALNELRVKFPEKVELMAGAYRTANPEFKFMTLDRKKMPLYGKVRFSAVSGSSRTPVMEVEFIKNKGDPMEWRYLFKKVMMSCSDAVLL